MDSVATHYIISTLYSITVSVAVIIQCHVRIYVVIGALGRIGSVGGEGKSCVANKLLTRSLASGLAWEGGQLVFARFVERLGLNENCFCGRRGLVLLRTDVRGSSVGDQSVVAVICHPSRELEAIVCYCLSIG